MAINIRTLTDTQTHLTRYNAVQPGTRIIEYARVGSVLLDRERVTALLSYGVQNGLIDPDKITGDKSLDNAVKTALNHLRESVIVGIVKRVAKRANEPTAADTAAIKIVSDHLPTL